MIKTIKINNVATFNKDGIEIDDCKRVNFIYGANGSGKTTVSNYLYNQENAQYSSSSISWENDIPLKVLVYNKQFRDKNFGNGNIAGIFTLGEASKEEIERINRKKIELDEIEKDIIYKKKTIGSLKEGVKKNEEEFRNIIWTAILKKNEEIFKEAFTGCFGSKTIFMARLLEEHKKGEKTSELRADLVKKAELIWGETPIYLNELKRFDCNSLIEIENDSIWQKKIIGKRDVDIAGLIQKLNIGDWVYEGRKHIQDDNTCPFCQKDTITEQFRSQINEFFSGEYEIDTKKLKFLSESYNRLKTTLVEDFESLIILEKGSSLNTLNMMSLTEIFTAITILIDSNQLLISEKIKEPSRSIKLNAIIDQQEKINKVIADANAKILENNRLVKNITAEKEELISNVWAMLIEENITVIDSFNHKKTGLEKGLDSWEKGLTEADINHKKLKGDIVEATKNITSVQPTIDEINKTLKSFGFQGFSIAPSKEENFYQIKREDGSLADSTLSEGEVTFITFLYFLQRSKGGSTSQNITENRVLIIDDPISSLDCNVLYIVSSLLKGIANEINNNKGSIKQMFILTHNVYFHKEVSFIDGRNNERKDTYYWILRKLENVTSIQCYKTKNPISTSYELLWKELRESKDASSVTIQNVMRRIIETYFKIMGRYKDEDITDSFSNMQEKEICDSLLCWINDGSHCIPDDLYVDCYADTSTKYFKVFEDIFKASGHISHYNMMMQTALEK